MYSGVTPEFGVTPESGVCINCGAPNLESLRGLKSRTNPKYGVLGSGCTPDYVVCIHSGDCSSDSLRSLKSRRSLQVVLTLDARSLDSLRSLQPRFTPESGGSESSPESVVTPKFVNWGYSGVWSLELLWRLQSGVCSHSGFVSLESTREFEVTPESGVGIHYGAPNLESLRGLESRNNPKY